MNISDKCLQKWIRLIDFANLQKDLNRIYKIERYTQILNKGLSTVTTKTCAVVVR